MEPCEWVCLWAGHQSVAAGTSSIIHVSLAILSFNPGPLPFSSSPCPSPSFLLSFHTIILFSPPPSPLPSSPLPSLSSPFSPPSLPLLSLLPSSPFSSPFYPPLLSLLSPSLSPPSLPLLSLPTLYIVSTVVKKEVSTRVPPIMSSDSDKMGTLRHYPSTTGTYCHTHIHTH